MAEPPECASTTRVVCALQIWLRVQVPSIIERAWERRTLIIGAVALHGSQSVDQQTRLEGDVAFRDSLATATSPNAQGPFRRRAGRTVGPHVLRCDQVSSARRAMA